MRKLLLCLAVLGMTALASPLAAQNDDDGGNGYVPPADEPPTTPVPPILPPILPPPIDPPPHGGPGWTGGNGGGNGGWPGYPPPPPPPPVDVPVPGVPPLPPPLPEPAKAPVTPPGGGVPGVPSIPVIPPASTPVCGPTASGPTGSTLGNGNTNGNGVAPGICGGPTVAVQPGVGGNGVIAARDAAKTDSVDRPLGVVRVALPNGNGNGNSNGNQLPPGTDLDTIGDVPPGTTPPMDPPTFIGEPLQGKFVLVLDASGSMAGGRIASLRAEATAAISSLTDTDEFDCMAYGTQFSDSTMEMWGGLMPATDDNKTAAISFVNGPALNPGGGTPTHRALEKACAMYPADLNKMFLVTDGAPNATGSASQILANFPGWWSNFPQETVLVAICIGGLGEAVNFMRDLASLDDSTGVFINKN